MSLWGGKMTIAEVSKEFSLSSDTLRYYEKIGLIPPIHKNKSGIRDYQEEDLKWIQFVKCMRSAGLPIEVLLEYMDLYRQGDTTYCARQQLLEEQRDRLIKRIEEMNDTLDKLNYKIERYKNMAMKGQL